MASTDAGSTVEHAFMHGVLSRLLREGRLRTSDRLLVTCAGPLDAEVLDALGLRERVLTGLGDPGGMKDWATADAEDLPFANGEFDVALVHAGLHHCRSPHRGLTEMLRVARRLAIVFESQDSLVMRLVVRLGLSSQFELDAVSRNGYLRGGVRDTAVPNFIHRWTRDELRKTVDAWLPELDVPVEFVSEFAFHEWNLGGRFGTHPFVRWLGPRLTTAAFRAAVAALNATIPGQGNAFCAVIDPGAARLRPWMERLPDGTTGMRRS